MIGMFNIDCMDFMAGKPDNYYSLAIVDPPYGINAPNMQMGTHVNRKGKGQYPGESTASKLRKGRLNKGSGKLKDRILNTSDCNWDTEKPTDEYFKELFRVSENQIIWGGNYFPLPPCRGMICWDKMQPWDNFSQFELAWTSFDKPARMFRYSNTGGANIEKKIHPTQKPVKLYEWLLMNYGMGGGQNTRYSWRIGIYLYCMPQPQIRIGLVRNRPCIFLGCEETIHGTQTTIKIILI